MIQSTDYDETLAALEAAVLDEDGRLKPIRRIEFELLDRGLVRWILWEARPGARGATCWRPAYTGITRADDMGGTLAATKMVLVAAASEEGACIHA